MRHKLIIKLMVLAFVFVLAVGSITGCQRVLFIPGASFGYYIWEDEGEIYLAWSVNRKDSSFEGRITTDGKLEDYDTFEWEENDQLEAGSSEISFTAFLGNEDYSDTLSIRISEYSYIELDLKINDGYDLSRIHIGKFLENPDNSPFRIEPGHFEQVRSTPWYRDHPFSEFFWKLYSNRLFTLAYIAVLGIVFLEILRITTFKKVRKTWLYLVIAYPVLFLVMAGVYFLLRFFVL